MEHINQLEEKIETKYCVKLTLEHIEFLNHSHIFDDCKNNNCECELLIGGDV